VNRRLQKIFCDVLSLPTAPFHENAVAAYIRAFARRRRIPVNTDRYGNLVLRYTNGDQAEPVALTAHMDHPGCEILNADGRNLTARWLGACDERHFPGGRLTLVSDGDEIPGRATSSLSDDKTFTARAARPLPQLEGAFGYWGLRPAVFDGGLIRTKGADNLASCAAILATMDRLNRTKAAADCGGSSHAPKRWVFSGPVESYAPEPSPGGCPLSYSRPAKPFPAPRSAPDPLSVWVTR
jgi:putative aminopeptidase FrvX